VRQGDPTRRPVQIGVLNAAKIVRLRSEPSCASPCCTARSSSPTVSPSCGRAGALGSPLPERVTGIDLFQSLLELADRDQRSVYLLGARPEVVARVRSVVGERYPGARLVGTSTRMRPSRWRHRSPSPGGHALPRNGVPEEGGIRRHLRRHPRRPGRPRSRGVVRVLAGITQRAPLAWQRAGMEWAFRLKQEPRRLARRYLTTNTAFLALTVQERMRPTAPYTAQAGT